ncbi:MAG: hypothetical protein ACP5P3_01380 [Ignavibacteria bacterium]
MWNNILQQRLDECKRKLKSIKSVEKERLWQLGLPEYIQEFIYNTPTADLLTNNELLHFCEKAIKLLINYTLRPKWTLLNFLFGVTESQSSRKILEQLKIFPFYNFYINAISDLLSETSSSIIAKTSVEKVIDDVNGSVYEGLILKPDATKVKNLFLQVYKLKYGDTAEILLENSVPYKFIFLFLSDKGFKTLLIKFKIISDLTDDTEIDLKTLIKILTNKYEPMNIHHSKEETGAYRENKIVQNAEDNYKSTIDTSQHFVSEALTFPPKKSFFGIVKKFLKKITFKKIVKEKPAFTSGINTSIQELFTSSELETIAKLVFQSDKTKVDTFFENINELKNWDEVASHLKTIFTLNKVDIYNSNVVNFVDKLNNLFTELKR